MSDGNAKVKFAEDAARFLRMFSGFAAYAEEVGKIGSLEQAAAEAEKRHGDAKKALGGVATEYEGRLAKARAEAARIVDTARQEAVDIVAKGRTAVAEAMRQVDISRTNTLAAAQAELADKEAAIKRTNEALVAAKATLTEMQNSVKAEKERRDAIANDARQAKVLLGDINDHIAAVRQRIG